MITTASLYNRNQKPSKWAKLREELSLADKQVSEAFMNLIYVLFNTKF